MSPAVRWWLPVACVVAGCSVRTQQAAEVGSVTVQVENPAAIPVANEVGVALVWAGATQARVTASVPLGGLEGEVQLPLSVPADAEALDLQPQQVVNVGATAVPVYRPRVAVYEDVDHSGAFEPGFLGGGGADRVLGVDGQESVGWIADPEEMLRSFRRGDADIYYAATGGLLTAFVRVTESEGNLALADGASPVPVRVLGGTDPGLDLSCHRVVRTTTQALQRAVAQAGTYHVDSSLDEKAVCGTQAGVCLGESLGALTPPPFDLSQSQDAWHVAQCRRSGELESVIVIDSQRSCRDCTCDWTGQSNVFVAATASPPAWWPCGTAVAYCDAAGSILIAAPECLPAAPSGSGCTAGAGMPNLLAMLLALGWLGRRRGR